MQRLQVNMLGEFSMQWGENRISSGDNRTKKVWHLLAYLICQKGRAIPAQKLIELLWGEDPASTNPENALRITFHRARTQLNGLWPEAGKELIQYREGGYGWNTQIPMEVDCDRFEALAHTAPEERDARLRDRLEAISLYRGDFLEKQAAETWVIPVSTHFHNLFVNTAVEAVRLLMEQARYEEAAQICRKAIGMEPYNEMLHQLLMQALAAQEDRNGAAGVYESLSKRLFDDFGIRPSAETRQVYRQTAHAVRQTVLPMDEVLEHLQEQNPAPGALCCDYDYFKVLCHAQSRDMERSGNAAHIVLLSASELPERPLTKRSMQRAMSQLGDQIRTNLRRGDTYSRCSATQYILMLPKANYENSCMVCRRVISAFQKAHPHVAVKLQYMVQPLTPSVRVP